jgi:hypothetical protein
MQWVVVQLGVGNQSTKERGTSEGIIQASLPEESDGKGGAPRGRSVVVIIAVIAFARKRTGHGRVGCSAVRPLSPIDIVLRPRPGLPAPLPPLAEETGKLSRTATTRLRRLRLHATCWQLPTWYTDWTHTRDSTASFSCFSQPSGSLQHRTAPSRWLPTKSSATAPSRLFSGTDHQLPQLTGALSARPELRACLRGRSRNGRGRLCSRQSAPRRGLSGP